MARRDVDKVKGDSAALGRRTARGFFWLMIQTVSTKTVNVGAQIALAWLLVPDDWALIALVMTIVNVLNQLRDAGMREVLVHRQKNFARWAGAAFWLSMTTGFGVALLIIASIPIALVVYQRPELQGLLLVAAINGPINTLGTVSDALLRSRMRFRVISLVGMGVFTGTSLMTVALAALGFGAYSWVIPIPIMSVVRAIVLWWVAKPKFSLKPRFRRWKYLVGDNVRLLGADLAIVGTQQSDRAVLGAMFPLLPWAGIYFFALNFTAQSIRLFVLNLTRVLFPALSKLQDEPQRQGRAYLRATSLLALVTIPLCLVQMPLAEPLVKLIFQPKWYDSIAVIQLLSIGMTGKLMQAPSRGMLMAQGRFGVLFTMSILYSISFVLFVVVGGLIGGQENGLMGVTIGSSLSMFIYGPIQIYVASRWTGGTWLDVWKTYALPLIGGAVAVVVSWFGGKGASMGAFWLLTQGFGVQPTSSVASWLPRLCEAIGVLVTMTGTYIGIIALFAPNDLREVKSRVRDMLARSKKKKKDETESTDSDDEAAKEIAEIEEEVRLPED